MTVKLVDSLDVLGGQLTTLYPEKAIYDVAGFPHILAKDLAAGLIWQALQFGAIPCLGERVERLDFDPATNTFAVVTHRNAHLARAILIAAGVGAFAPKALPLPNAKSYEGRGLYYFVKHLEELRDHRVLIVGGGDSAVDWANTLAGLTRTQTLIHRRDAFRAHEESVQRLRNGPTNLLLFHELKAIGGKDRIEWATVYDNRTQTERTLEVDAVLVNIGFNSSLGPLRDWGLALEGGSIRVDSTMRTSREGIFAAGDIVTYPGKLKLIATGFGEAATAANHAKHYLDPSAKPFPGHSTELIPKR
jgi:thioredoxin reductase (NADPH)